MLGIPLRKGIEIQHNVSIRIYFYLPGTRIYLARHLVDTNLIQTNDSLTTLSTTMTLTVSGNAQSSVDIGDTLLLSDGTVVGIVDSIASNTSIGTKIYKDASFDYDSLNVSFPSQSRLYRNQAVPLIQLVNMNL